jgi:hypothetical protein
MSSRADGASAGVLFHGDRGVEYAAFELRTQLAKLGMLQSMNRAGKMNDWAAAGSVDTDLSFLSFLKVYRTDVADRRMASSRVVEPLDVVEHVGTGLLSGSIDLSGNSFCLQ